MEQWQIVVSKGTRKRNRPPEVGPTAAYWVLRWTGADGKRTTKTIGWMEERDAEAQRDKLLALARAHGG